MRILHVQETLAPNFGGPARVLPQLAAAQARARFEVEILTTNADTPSGQYRAAGRGVLAGTDIPVTYCEVWPDILRFSADFAGVLRRTARSFDIIHIHGLYRFPQSYAAHFARRAGIPYIVRPHGSLDPYLYARSSRSLPLKRLYERMIDLPNLNGAAAIHYTTEDERRLAAFMKLRAPSFVVPNGLDWAPYATLPARGALRSRFGIGDAPVVLFLGRLHHKKGLDILIDAFAGLHAQDPAVRLVIAGPEPDGYGAELRKWISGRGLDSSVTFTGALSGSEVVEAFVDCDVFVLPSYTENFGMSVVEAMASAAPVIISDQVNIHEEAANAGAAIVTRCDAHDVRQALTSLLADPGKRKSLGATAREFVRGRYAWPAIVDALGREYEKILARQRAR